MPKPFADRTGSGAHMHYHLADAETGKNLFTADERPARPGPVGAGLPLPGRRAGPRPGAVRRHSPTVNCYKRLQIGQGLYRRALRLHLDAGLHHLRRQQPHADDPHARTPGHVEDRTVSAAFNPYLRMAAYIAAGLDGIERKLDPGDPNIGGNMYEIRWRNARAEGLRFIPQSLDEAIDELEADEVVRSALGPELAREFIEREASLEWVRYHSAVGRWEVDEYLTLF